MSTNRLRHDPSRHTLVIVLLLTVCRITSASPSWSVVNLNGDSTLGSVAFGVTGNVQVGQASWGANELAAQWLGSASSRVAVHQANGSAAFAVSSEGVVGYTGYANPRPAFWKGSERAFVDLAPPEALDGLALGIDGSYQVGRVRFQTGNHAALWSGTPESFVDLNPAGTASSVAAAVDASGQAGSFSATENAQYHAALWHGSAESIVDLHPAGAYASQAKAISNGRQGGYVQLIEGRHQHAALWAGTPESYTDLNPSWVWTAVINGIDAGVQAGSGVRVRDADSHALVWFGTAESCLDLHMFLSSEYVASEARAVDVDEFGTIRVVGYAFFWTNNQDGTLFPHNEAMMWVLVPEPSSLAALVAGLAGLAAVRRRRSKAWTSLASLRPAWAA